jgi:RNA polymerase sigma-70 factor (ECF subfamily)
MSDNSPINSSVPGSGRFTTTHWSVILAAGCPESPGYRQALQTLCQTYWFPLYAYLRRRGYDRHQSEDYTQAFFASLLERRGLEKVQPKHGKFRSFLLASLKNFLADEWDRAQAQKRGGDRKILSLNIEDAETWYSADPADHLSPEKLFEKSWALTVLKQAMAKLKAEFVAANKQQLFDHLKAYLTTETGSVPYRQVAAKLDMTEGAVKVAVHRLRQRYREIVRQHIAQTVSTPDEVDDEIQDLFAALAG